MDAKLFDKPPPKKREPDPIWDAVCLAFGLHPVTKSECSRVGGIVRDLKLKQATPQDIAVQVARYRKTFAKVICSPEAVLKWWDSLLHEATKRAPVAPTVAPLVAPIPKPVPLSPDEIAFQEFRRKSPIEAKQAVQQAAAELQAELGVKPPANAVMRRVLATLATAGIKQSIGTYMAGQNKRVNAPPE